MRTILTLAASFLLALTIQAQESVTVRFYTPNTVRIVKGGPAPEGSYAVIASPQDVAVKTSTSRTGTTYASSALRVNVDKEGRVSFLTPKGALLIREGEWSLTERTQGADKGAKTVSQTFLPAADEPFYGLGILQDGALSLRGKTRQMIQGNQEDFSPVVQSVRGYGIFWDNTSPTTFRDDENGMLFSSEVGQAVDYYFIYGGNADGVISGIRELTGHVPMLPLWSYGFSQSRERYKTPEQLLEVLGEYRSHGIPLDCIIQDWQYWGSNYLWNAMDFLNEDYYNKGQRMIDAVHGQNAKIMISIWSSFGPQTLQFRELQEKGLLLDFETWPPSGLGMWPPMMNYPSGVRCYDVYSPEARDIYWKYLSKLDKMGIDAWWMDSTDPDHLNYGDPGNDNFQEEDFEIPTAAGSWRKVRNAFPIAAVEGVHDHQRADSPRRVMILTRSMYTGQQRTGANTWSGDIQSNWRSLRAQVPAGLGFALTGNPNFNSDLGGFFAGSWNQRGGNGSAVDNDGFRELYVRWVQYGVFSPMMRSHGTEVPREIYLYGKAGEPVYDALVGAVKLRYALLPYIYSTAWKVSSADGTFQRALMMDFPKDRKCWEIADEFMFGDALLVAPVLNAQYNPERPGWTDVKADFSKTGTRDVYLPAGSDWYDFWTGKRLGGGQVVTRETTLGTIPLYVRAGSIVPVGPDVQYSSEKPWDELEIRVYPGTGGSFILYEDEGDGYGYEQGVRTEIEFRLSGKTLSIAARKGRFPGMLESRTFRIVTPDGTERTVRYEGKAVSVKL